MKTWYVKLEILIKVRAEDQMMAESFIQNDMIEEMLKPNLHKDIKIIDTCIDACSFDIWEDWKEDYF